MKKNVFKKFYFSIVGSLKSKIIKIDPLIIVKRNVEIETRAHREIIERQNSGGCWVGGGCDNFALLKENGRAS